MQANIKNKINELKICNSRPNSSNLNKTHSKPIQRPHTAIITKEISPITNVHIKINSFNTNNNFRPTRPASSAKDRIFNKYWVNNFPSENNFHVVGNYEHKQLQGESLITNELLVDLKKKERSNYNRRLYKFNKIDWDVKKTGNFLTSIGGLEIKSNNCILNSHSGNNYENLSLNTTAAFSNQLSRPQSKTGNSNNNFYVGKNQRPMTGIQIDNRNKLRLNSGKLEKNTLKNEDKINKRPLTGNVVNRINLRPISASNKLIQENLDNKKITINILSESIDDPISEIFDESLSLNLSTEKILKKQKPIISSYKTTNHNTNVFEQILINTKNQIKCSYPKVSNMTKNFEKLDVKAYSIKLQVADADLLDLFDRSQRTKAATLAKVGDYQYYTPCQRIGSFMDFSETLKWEDLKNIEKHYMYTKNQVGFLQSKHNIITLVEKNFLINKSEFFRDPNSLFHGFLKDEYLLDKYYKDLIQNKKTYDPVEFLPKSFHPHLFNPQNWTESFSKLFQNSMINYYKYFNSDKITNEDLHPFDDNIRVNILGKIDFRLYEKKKKIINKNFEEIKEDYNYFLKTVIMQYILRSPYERKRLNIQYFPKTTPPSSITIANHGSFNRSLYVEWVRNYGMATENIENNLFVSNIIASSVLEWTESFKHLDLLYLKKIRNFNKDKFSTMHLENFKEIQNTYIDKTFYFLRDIYYRGIILILKKNKFFKRKNDKEGKWTFKGFINKSKLEEFANQLLANSSYDSSLSVTAIKNGGYKEDIEFGNDFIGMDIFDRIDDFWSNLHIEDFMDIRINISYYAYFAVLKKNQIDLASCLYEEYNEESKLKLNNSITTFVNLFFRQIIEKSLKELVDFILSFPLVEKLIENLINNFSNEEEKINNYNKNTNKNKNIVSKKNLISPEIFEIKSSIENINLEMKENKEFKPPEKKNLKNLNLKKIHHNKTKNKFDNNLMEICYNINDFIYYKENEIKLPYLKSFFVSDVTKPLMHINTKIDYTYKVIKLEYSYDQISEYFIKIIDNIVNIFNGLHTTHFLEFTKILPSDVERVQKAHWMRINEIFVDKLDSSYKEYYSNVSPNLIIDDDHLKNPYIFFNSNVKHNFLKPAVSSEDIFMNYKNIISTNIKEHFLEMEESIEIFEPIKDLINNSFIENITNFVENFGAIPEYNKFTFIIDKIRTYQSLFAVDTSDSKAELNKRLNENMILLMRTMENLIIDIYVSAIENYNKLHKQIDKKINNPDELVEMDIIKNNLNLEVMNLNKSFDDANKIFLFLLISDNLFSDILIQKTEEMKRRFNKFRRDYEEIDKLHQKDKEFLENKYREDRKILEEDLKHFYEEIKSLDNDVHINTYELIVEKIVVLETKIDIFKTRIDNIYKDEEKLFNFKINSFEEYDKALGKLSKFSIFWKNGFTFYELKKQILLNFSYELEFLQIVNQLNDIEKTIVSNKSKTKKDEEIVIKMTKILEDDLDITREFILLIYNLIKVKNLDDNLRFKIIEMLESKKLEQSCKMLIGSVLQQKNFSLV